MTQRELFEGKPCRFTVHDENPRAKLTGTELGRDLMAKAAKRRGRVLERARAIADRVASSNPEGIVTADQVLEGLAVEGVAAAELGNAAGSIFRGGSWECVGWRTSERKSNHGRALRAWRKRPE